MATQQFVDSIDSPRKAERAPERKSDRREERRLERPSAGFLTDDGMYALDMSKVPPGMKMEWKRHTLLGMDDKRNQVVIRQFHWEPVPHKLQPHILGHTSADENQHIVVGGLGLYMRPDYLCEEADQEAVRNADYVTSQQLQSLRLQSREQVGDRFTKIKRTAAQVQAVD